MRVTVDSNVVLRAIVQDDAAQAAAAEALLRRATLIAVPAPVFCEVAWVLKRGYGYAANDVASAIEAIAKVDGVATDRPALEAGLRAMAYGADFADGVIAYQGGRSGGVKFASFDRRAVEWHQAEGGEAGNPADLIAGAESDR